MTDPALPERPQSGGLLGAVARWLLAREASRISAEPRGADAPGDIVDQAEAFQSLRVGEVMTPRADVVSVEVETPLGDVLRQFAENEHSRMPVYRETLDDPLGVVHIKDVVKLLVQPTAESVAFAPDWSAPILGRLRREALYVPASMRAADLLLRMQSTRMHMALVIDEFGGVDGLVTLEDLLEAVVGEIEDEHDTGISEPDLEPRGPDLWESDARVALERLEAATGFDLGPSEDEEEVDTIAGLVFVLAGRVPQRGEVVSHPEGLEFEVLDADPRRIKRLRIRRLTAAAPDAEPDPA